MLYISADIPGDCLQARCEIVFDIQCPGDSVKIEAQRLLGECCPQPPRCECDRSTCPELLCGDGYDRLVGSPGTEVPGSCCDIYECQPTGGYNVYDWRILYLPNINSWDHMGFLHQLLGYFSSKC